MKLLTDEREDIAAFKSDFERACRKLARASSRSGMTSDEVAVELIQATKYVMKVRQARRLNSREVWHLAERIQALEWLMIIAQRWLDHQADGPLNRPTQISDLSAEMFMEVAQRVANDLTGGRYPIPLLPDAQVSHSRAST